MWSVYFPKTSFLRMIEHSDDHRDIVKHEELKDLLDNLPPPPDRPEPSPKMPRDAANLLLNSDSLVEQSPKPLKRKGPFKMKDRYPRKQSLGESQAAEVVSKNEPRGVPQFNPLAVVNRSEEFKKEFLHRLSLMFQEEEEVLVISLGYSSIECPGMLSEEKVLEFYLSTNRKWHICSHSLIHT